MVEHRASRRCRAGSFPLYPADAIATAALNALAFVRLVTRTATILTDRAVRSGAVEVALSPSGSLGVFINLLWLLGGEVLLARFQQQVYAAGGEHGAEAGVVQRDRVRVRPIRAVGNLDVS